VTAPDASLQDVALIAGPAFSAIAAGAAWAAVAQNNRINRRANQPALRVQLIRDPGTGFYGGVIANVGEGVASGVGFAIADRETVIAGYAGHGFLRPGQAVEVLAASPPHTGEEFPTRGVAICRDRFGIPNDWTSAGDHFQRYKRRWRSGFQKRPEYTDYIELLCNRFPEWTAKDDLTQVPVAKERRVEV
jgi:hypothetical protein